MDRIDLNADVGESYGAYKIGRDDELLPLITSANVACGFHGGDPAVMAHTIRLALLHGVGIGAHPGYRDLAGFGRRALACSEEEIYGDVLYQLGALHSFARAASTRLSHVKPHGAMYNVAFHDQPTARGIVRAVQDFNPALPIFAMPGSALLREAEAVGLPVVREVFADRAYNGDGTLVDRRLPGAVIHDAVLAAERVVRMVKSGQILAVDGSLMEVQAETVCVHGDNPEALALIEQIRRHLSEAGVQIARAHAPLH